MANKNVYTAKDCLDVYKNEEKATDRADEFLTNVCGSTKSISFFCILNRERYTKPEPIVFFDYNTATWRAGRYIGNIDYSIGRKQYSLSIVPRFGENILMELLGEVFNVNSFGGKSRSPSDRKNLYIKMLISLIWSQKLSEANRYGLPRKRAVVYNKGFTVKGKLLVRPSIVSFAKDRTIISRSYDSTYDEKIITIISKAYNVLKREYAFEQLSISPNNKDTITDIESVGHALKNLQISENDYQSISYQPIYQSYKDLVDFSWQIINSSTGMNTKDNGKNVSGYLIDMAEVWECYVRSLVSKQMRSYGWRLIDSTFWVYENTFFKRKLIPDIVLEKDGEYCVFDAKYKRMQYQAIDLDREDFFQIHTYISFLQKRGKVRIAGLLYPIENIEKSANSQSALFNYDNECLFIADGPYIRKEHVEKDRIIEFLKDAQQLER